MTDYSRLMNEMKEQCDETWLTPSQKSVFDKITKGFRNHRVIDVYGGEGSGKTFLGWVLEKKGFGKYFVNRESIEGSDLRIVVVDNFPSERDTQREFRSRMGSWCITRAVVLTRYAIPDDIPKIDLDFNDDDRRFFKHICYDKVRLQIEDETGQDNMHDLLKKNIWRLLDD